MYRLSTSPRERAATIVAVVLVHLALAFALTNLWAVARLKLPDDLTRLIDVTVEPQPPIVEVQPQTPKPKEKKAAASARNIDSKATEIVAPEPKIIVPTTNPMTATFTPRQGDQATQGASTVVGPGAGAGGVGDGDGSGGAGNGNGGAGSGVAVRAQLLTRGIRPRDFPPQLRDRAQNSGSPLVLFTVATNGRVYDCHVYRSSGDPDIDRTTCALVTARHVYRPALNQRGEPVASGNGFEFRN